MNRSIQECEDQDDYAAAREDQGTIDVELKRILKRVFTEHTKSQE